MPRRSSFVPRGLAALSLRRSRIGFVRHGTCMRPHRDCDTTCGCKSHGFPAVERSRLCGNFGRKAGTPPVAYYAKVQWNLSLRRGCRDVKLRARESLENKQDDFHEHGGYNIESWKRTFIERINEFSNAIFVTLVQRVATKLRIAHGAVLMQIIRDGE